MDIKTDISYGVVPLYRDGDDWLVLLIHQISHRGDRFWIFPKGHAEEPETPEAAALRELEEETGVSKVTLETSQTFSMAYTFVHESVRINKQVVYFVGYCEVMETNITQPQEVIELKWCTFAEADLLLTHQNSKDVLTQVQNFLQGN